jgi:hypothetical protein
MEAALVADAEAEVPLARQIRERSGAFAVDRERLFGEDVLACFQRRPDVLRVEVVGGRDPDRVDVRVVQQRRERVVRPRATVPRGKRS